MTLNMKLNEARKEGTMETLLALVQLNKLSVEDTAQIAGMSVSDFQNYITKQQTTTAT